MFAENYTMKIKQLLIGLFIFLPPFFFGSCGQGTAEKTRLQAVHDDSVKNAVEQNLKQKYAAKEAIQNSIQSLTSQLDGVNKRIEFLKANLEVANDEMNKIKEFHFGRSDNEREEQIRNQSLKIQNLEDEITALNSKINQDNSQLAEYNGELENANTQQ